MIYETVELTCFIAGTYAFLSFLFNLLQPFLHTSKNLLERYGGGWAVVTGGTDGIGLGYCEELARLGFNICIISRNQEKLRKVEKELRQKNQKIDTKIIQADFSKCFEENFFENILKELEGLNVSMLVNNVGTLNLGLYQSFTFSEINHEAKLNLVPITMLTHFLLPSMLKKRKSCIINLSSFSSYFALVGGAGYCSSKLYDDFLSRALTYEYKEKIDFLSFKPLLVSTPLTRNLAGCLILNKNECVKGSLRVVGCRTESFGHWSHHIQGEVSMIFSKGVQDFFGRLYWKWFTKHSHSINPSYTPVKANL